MSKLDQLRAMRERQAAKPKPTDKIKEGLQEALAVARGEAEPYRITEHCPTCGQRLPVKCPSAKFDRNAYQREYMRKRRAAAKKPQEAR